VGKIILLETFCRLNPSYKSLCLTTAVHSCGPNIFSGAGLL